MQVVFDAIIRSTYKSEKTGRTYATFLEAGGNEYHMQSEAVDLSALPKSLMPYHFEAELGGRVFSGEKGPVQRLNVLKLQYAPLVQPKAKGGESK